MNGPPRELRGCGSPAVLVPRRFLASRRVLVPCPVLASGATAPAPATKPHPSAPRAPHGAAARTRVRTLVLPNKEPQP